MLGGFGLMMIVIAEYLSTINVPMLYVPQCIVFHPVSPETLLSRIFASGILKQGVVFIDCSYGQA